MISRILAACAVVFLVGCASGPQKIGFDRTGSSVRSVAILTPGINAQPELFRLSGATPLGILFGPLGALADAKIQEGRAADFEGALQSRHYVPADVLVGDLTAALTAEGYTVSTLAVARAGVDLLKQYPPQSAAAPVDAYLDIAVVNWGYLAGAITQDYRPLVGLQYRLVRAADGTTLMQGTFAYAQGSDDAVPDPAYQVSSHDDIIANVDHSIEGINAGFSLGANAIAKGMQ